MPVEMVDAVAKTKAKPAKARAAERKPLVLQVRGSTQWKAWFEAMAEREQDTLAKFVERIAKKFAKENGYPDPPRR